MTVTIILTILRWFFWLMSMRCGMGYWQKIYDHANRFKKLPIESQQELKIVPVPLYIIDGGRRKALFVKHGNLLAWCGLFIILSIIIEILTHIL